MKRSTSGTLRLEGAKEYHPILSRQGDFWQLQKSDQASQVKDWQITDVVSTFLEIKGSGIDTIMEYVLVPT